MSERTGAERTEEATPRRLTDARRRGQAARSRDLQGGVVLAAALGTVAWYGPGAAARLLTYVRAVMSEAPRAGAATTAMANGWYELGILLAPVLIAAMLAAIGIGVLQTGGIVTLAGLRFDPGRVMPRRDRLASVATLVELGKGLLRTAVFAVVGYAALRPLIPAIAALPGRPVRTMGAIVAAGARAVALPLVLCAVALGAADLIWQRRRHRMGLRMTRDEVRREHKDSEGDPRHKSERQRLHRELMEQRMLADVRKAHCVVVNPDHIAVALRYDRDADGAPVVVARGERLVAERIKEAAREAGVPIFRDVPLARALAALDEGDEIPEALYEAVAEILRVVYDEQTAVSPDQTPEPEPPPAPGAGWKRA